MSEESSATTAPRPAPDFRLVCVAFDDPDQAPRALERLLAARRSKQMAVPAVASVRKDAQGLVEIDEPGDVGAKEGAVAGGLVGGLLGGLFGRKVVAGAAIGAALAALSAAKHDAGIPNPRLEVMGEALLAGSSALVAIVEEEAVAGLRTFLGATSERMTVEPIALDLDVARQLSAGQYGEAAGSLATHAESLIGEAKARLAEAAGSVARQSRPEVGSEAETTASLEANGEQGTPQV